MQKKVRDYIREHQMFQKGDRVVAAVSGGADSVCLLYLLVDLKDEFGIEISAAHLHHGIRGEEADRDADYVKELCKKLGVPCFVVQKEVPQYAKEHRISLEEAGRILRYQMLREEAKRCGGAKIAVAHHGDDQAETILHNLFRGSGLRGLGGMAPVNGDIVRPLLCCSRNEIEEYLEDKGVTYCEDSTNASVDYTRNKLRNIMIPMIVADVNQGAVGHILHTGETVAQADAYLRQVSHKILKEWGKSDHGRIGISLELLTEQELIIQTYLMMDMMEFICGRRKDLTARHVQQVLELLKKEVGARVDLPYALQARKSYEELWIENKNIVKSVSEERKTEQPEVVYSHFPYEKHGGIPENQYTKWFDYDKIEGVLSVRNRQTGDYITLKDEKRKTVKSYMIDEKIPREQRDTIPLLAEGNHILWIVGYRISEYYKVTDKTKQILQVNINGGR